MPYQSDAQRRWAHTPAGLEALGGETAVNEWDQASAGKKLPERVHWPGALGRAKKKVYGNGAI